jgi:hypothetical protein
VAKRKEHPLVGTYVKAVSRMPPDELSMRGWERSPAVITLEKRRDEIYRLFPVSDGEGNSPGVVFGDSPQAAFYLFGSVDDQKILQGLLVHDIRPMTSKELERQGWDIFSGDQAPTVLVLRNMILYPSRDAEGNGPGAWRVDSADGEESL